MVSDAESHAAEDHKAREAADARNQADQMVYQVEKMLKENESKLAGEDLSEVHAALQATKDAMEKGDVGAIKAANESLEKSTHKLAEVIYRTQEAGGEAGGAAPGDQPPTEAAEGDGDVIDAEVVESDASKS